MTNPGLLRSAARRLDADGFAAAFAAAAPALWTAAAGVLGDRSEAEDVLQEAALIGLRRLDQFQPGTDFRAWCGRIVRYTALNRRRQQRRARTERVDPALLAEMIVAREPGSVPPVDVQGALLAHAAFDAALQRALDRLRPTARACLLLKVVMEFDYEAIAQTLGIPAGTAMSHVHRARATLRRALSGPSAGETP
jgi:RNA polymerase sigma-70 factor (ECF subfamily)